MDRQRAERIKEFKNPGIKYRSKPFWAWNGKLEEQELYRQLDILKEMGFGGAFIHSRVGLETEYMGPEWMELVDKCLKYGKEIGLELWIYDEDRWPSGTAGGLVTEKKENRSKRLQLKVLTLKEAVPYLEEKKEQLAGLYSCTLKGHEYENLQRWNIEDYNKIKISADQKILAVTIEESEFNDNYNGYTYLDTMKASAVEDYLEATHDRYEQELSEEGLSCMKGIFTDEPHRGAFLCDFSEGNQKSIPYTDGLFDLFQERYGYDLKKELPAVFFRGRGNPFSKTASDYVELTQELFLENYLKQYQERSHKYGWDFTGHLLHEDSLSSQTCMLGSLMTGYEYMDIPGIDLLGEKTSCWWIGKQLSSVAHQLDKKGMLTELYGCTGWQVKFQGYKEIGDWQAMFGINLFCPHLSWYTMAGENKRDYPASIFYQSAWYKQYKHIEDYFARIHVATEGRPADCRLLVLNPIESVWARAYSGGFNWLTSGDEGITAIENQYQETFRMLMRAGIDFDYGEERILARYGSVKENRIQVGSCTYDKVLLSGVETIRESTWKLLEEFEKQGGDLIIAGKVPERIGALPDARMRQLTQMARKISFDEEAVSVNCKPEYPVYTLKNHGQNVFLQSYQKEKDTVFVLLNMDREKSAGDIELTVKSGRLELWNARTGEISGVAAQTMESLNGESKQKIIFHLEPGEERIYVLHTIEEEACFHTEKVTRETKNPKEKDTETDLDESTWEHLSQSSFKYRLSEPNVGVLDRVDVYLDKELILSGEEVLKADRKLRDRIGYPWRGGEMMQPWYVAKYHSEQLKIRHKVQAVYYFYVDKIPDHLEIAAEVRDDYTSVKINGQLIPKSEGFWLDKAFKRFSAGSNLLHEGENSITLAHEYGKDSGLESIYLLGDFGVTLKPERNPDDVHLTNLPQMLMAGDIVKQGLPFYSGTITYELVRKIEGEIEVRFEDMPAALAVLHGDTDQITAFVPYEARISGLSSIEVIFNRRNTFGPLHLPVSYRGTYGPETFLTEDAQWTEEMQLYSQGLSQNITFHREK